MSGVGAETAMASGRAMAAAIAVMSTAGRLASGVAAGPRAPRVKAGVTRPPITVINAARVRSPTRKPVPASRPVLPVQSRWAMRLPLQSRVSRPTSIRLRGCGLRRIWPSTEAAISGRKARSAAATRPAGREAENSIAMRPASQVRAARLTKAVPAGAAPVQFGTAVRKKPATTAAA